MLIVNFSVRKVNSFVFLSCIDYNLKEIIYFCLLHNRKHNERFTLLCMTDGECMASISLNEGKNLASLWISRNSPRICASLLAMVRMKPPKHHRLQTKRFTMDKRNTSLPSSKWQFLIKFTGKRTFFDKYAILRGCFSI